MRRLWSGEHKRRLWRRIWVALAEAVRVKSKSRLVEARRLFDFGAIRNLLPGSFAQLQGDDSGGTVLAQGDAVDGVRYFDGAPVVSDDDELSALR